MDRSLKAELRSHRSGQDISLRHIVHEADAMNDAQRAGTRIANFRTLFAMDEIDNSTVAVSKAKRETSPPPPASPATLKAFAKQVVAGGSKLTVAILKEGLTAMGLSKSGNKPDLYKRARDALVEKGYIEGAGGDVKMKSVKKETKSVKRENGAVEVKKEKGKAAKYDSMDDDSDAEPSRAHKFKRESSSPKKKSKEDWDSSSGSEVEDRKPNLLILDDDSD